MTKRIKRNMEHVDGTTRQRKLKRFMRALRKANGNPNESTNTVGEVKSEGEEATQTA
jgi:hypothetical protein